MKIYILFIINILIYSANSFAACELFESGINAPHGRENLTKFWAQEYTGADLVREELQAMDLKIKDNLLEVWDSKLDDPNKHGERVAQLIIGPYQSALIPREESVRYKDVEHERGQMEPADKFVKLFNECRLRGSCPNFINNSMSWLRDNGIKNAVSKISNHGTLLVTSAGNGRRMVERGKRELARQKKIILVGNTNKLGFPAKYTDFAPEVSVSAPSDDSLTTYDYDGNLKNFSGTSGSAPQVLASLASFSIVTGLKIDARLALKLFEKSSLSVVPKPNNIGGGSLNAYKIFHIAKIAKKKCSRSYGKKRCIEKLLNKLPSNLSRLVEKRSIKNKLKKVFPRCAGGSSLDILLSLRTCKVKMETLKDLRRSAFLNETDSSLWKTLSCITKKQGFSINAQFYKNIGRHQDMSDDEMISEYFKYDNDYKLVRYVLSNPYWVKYPEYAKKAIKREQSDWSVDNYLFSSWPWKNYFKNYLNNIGVEPLLESSFIRQHL